MPGDQGSQTVSIIFHASAQSSIVNRRHKDTRMLGIYKGGYVTIVPPLNVSLSPLVCEISDGTHQVRVETTEAVSLPVAKATEWVVLRWTYTGVAAADYMAILAVDSPLTNDIVVGKCSFVDPGVLQGFDYGERSDPDIQHLFLRVESTGETELRVRIRGGRIQTNSGVVDIPDQKSDPPFTRPTSNSKVYLVYVTAAGVIAIDSSGTASATPVAPSYKGKLVLAEVTLASTDTSITASMIEDVRNFITQPVVPDDIYITRAVDGKLTVVRCFRDYILIRDVKAPGTQGGTFTSGAWQTRDLTEETFDDGGHAGLGANQITLAAGTYEFRIQAPAYEVGGHQIRLYNVTDATVIALGSSARCGYLNIGYSIAVGKFTISGSKVLRVEHYGEVTYATTGFGRYVNNGGVNEVYTIAEFWKVA